MKFDLMWDYLWFMFICAIHITLFSCGKDNNVGLDSDALVSTGGVNRWLIDDRYLERKTDPYSQKKRIKILKRMRPWDFEIRKCGSAKLLILLKYFLSILHSFSMYSKYQIYTSIQGSNCLHPAGTLTGFKWQPHVSSAQTTSGEGRLQ